MFYLLIDEYENLLDGQQQIMNTLLKHVPECYTFKIGVRELGWRVKYTLNKLELLNDPADYSLINITEQFSTNDRNNDFAAFALNVCNKRINELFDGEANEGHFSIEKSLPGMSIEEESELLKVKYSDFSQITRSTTGNQILSSKDTILPLAKRLLQSIEFSPTHPIRLLGLSVSNPSQKEKTGPRWIEGWLPLEW